MKTEKRLARWCLPDAEEKPAFVNEMFGRIAARYDRLNGLMTVGQDRRWRDVALGPVRPACERSSAGRGHRHGRRRARRTQDVSVCRDLSPRTSRGRWCRRARDGQDARTVQFALADAFGLPFDGGEFDAVITSFVMRNVVDRRAAFREQARVTRPGGRVVCLETSPPQSVALGPLFRFYFFRIVPIMGSLIAGDGRAYSYLPASTVEFPAPDELARDMELAGLRNVMYRTLMFGSVAVHVGTK